MILTLNYGDLQDIKSKMKEEKNKSGEKIYSYIEAYKDTLNYMYENNLIKNTSKSKLEDELQDFAKSILAETKISYRELEKQCRPQITTSYIIKPNEIRVKL